MKVIQKGYSLIVADVETDQFVAYAHVKGFMIKRLFKWSFSLIIALTTLTGFSSRAFAQATGCSSNNLDMSSSGVNVTNTLPVLYINTENGQPVTSKTEYIKASYWLDVKGHTEFESIGTSETPLAMQIRGRGHSSWKSEKKPYKLKLDIKQSVLGMPKNKHWVLLKPNEGNIAGMALGKLLEMEWTPSFQPVEVVMNNNYLGLYMLGENIRVAKDRVNIYEQADYETNSDLITGGWLVEIDNYLDPNQISIQENDLWSLRVTYHCPENLSTVQRNWLTQEFKAMNSAIYSTDKLSTTWEDYIDIENMAKYFIIQEVMDNPDGFHGSFYLHKDLGDGQKWKAGPLWDLLCYYRPKTDYTFRMSVHYNFIPHWIGEIIQYQSFCEEVSRIWNNIYPEKISQIYNIIAESITPMSMAWKNDNILWNQDQTMTASYRIEKITNALKANIQWFNEHFPISELQNVPDDFNGDFSYQKTSIQVYNLQGLFLGTYSSLKEAQDGLPKGLYVINGQKFMVR